MPAHGYRLESSLLAVERYADGRSALRVLAPGTNVVLLPRLDPVTGMVGISAGTREFEVFKTDLEDRAIPVILDARSAVCG